MKGCRYSFILFVASLLAVASSAPCDVESGVQTSRFRALYGKNYVGKVETTSAMPSERTWTKYLTAAGLVLDGPFIYDIKSKRLKADLSDAIGYGGDAFHRFYYNGHNDTYYILTKYSLFEYSLAKSAFVKRISHYIVYDQYFDFNLLYCDDKYIYYQSKYASYDDKHKGNNTCWIYRMDFNEGGGTEIELTRDDYMDLKARDPIFAVYNYDGCRSIIDWRGEKAVITDIKIESEWREYIGDDLIVVQKKVDDIPYLECYNIHKQDEVVWTADNCEFDSAQMPDGIIIRRDDTYYYIDKKNGNTISKLENSLSNACVSWYNGYGRSYKSDVINIMTDEKIINSPDYEYYRDTLITNRDRTLACMIILDAIVVMKLNEWEELYRVKKDLPADNIKIYWSENLGEFFAIIWDKNDQPSLYAITKEGMRRIEFDQAASDVAKERIKLICKEKVSAEAIQCLDKDTGISSLPTIRYDLCVFHVEYVGEVYVITGEKCKIYSIDKQYRPRAGINDRYCIIYNKNDSKYYLYEYGTQRKCVIDEYVRSSDGFIIYKNTRRDIIIYDVNNKTSLIVPALIKYGGYYVNEKITFLEAVKNLCYIGIRPEPCAPDGVAQRISMFLDGKGEQ